MAVHVEGKDGAATYPTCIGVVSVRCLCGAERRVLLAWGLMRDGLPPDLWRLSQPVKGWGPGVQDVKNALSR